uniref:Vesicle transport protein SEC20 n=1 Tax=Macrostomum lignano TaxID=282301 RepID=A0A1I8F4Y2_9PLAT
HALPELQDGNPRVSQTLEELVRQDARLKEAIADLRSPEACRSQRDLASLESVGRECLREIRRLLRQLDGLLDAVEGDAERARVEREARNCQCSLQASPGGDARDGALQRKQALQEAERVDLLRSDGADGGIATFRAMMALPDAAFANARDRRCRRLALVLLLSNQLAEQVEASSETANRLLRSSEQLTETGEELKSMTGHISTAKRLLTRLSRRDFTDKVLIFLAFVFFFSTCAYIVKKRTIGVTVDSYSG